MQNKRKEVEFFDQFSAQHHDYDVLGPSAYARLTGSDAISTARRPLEMADA